MYITIGKRLLYHTSYVIYGHCRQLTKKKEPLVYRHLVTIHRTRAQLVTCRCSQRSVPRYSCVCTRVLKMFVYS